MPVTSPPNAVIMPKMPPDGMEKVVCVVEVPSSSVTLISPVVTIALVESAGITIVCVAVVSSELKNVASPICSTPESDSTWEVSKLPRFRTPKKV